MSIAASVARMERSGIRDGAFAPPDFAQRKSSWGRCASYGLQSLVGAGHDCTSSQSLHTADRDIKAAPSPGCMVCWLMREKTKQSIAITWRKKAPGNEHNRGRDPAHRYQGVVDGGGELCRCARADRPDCLYLSRMSFLTLVTPATWRVTSTAFCILAWVLTKPLN